MLKQAELNYPKDTKVCAITGHRPSKLKWGYNQDDESCKKLKQHLTNEVESLIAQGYKIFLSGQAEGIDLYFSRIIIDLKEQYSDILLYCIIPFEEQAATWKEAERKEYFSTLESCDKELILQTHYSEDCYRKRNQYLVDHADCLIAVLNNKRSGAAMTYNMAKKKGIEIIEINPDTLKKEQML